MKERSHVVSSYTVLTSEVLENDEDFKDVKRFDVPRHASGAFSRNHVVGVEAIAYAAMMATQHPNAIVVINIGVQPRIPSVFIDDHSTIDESGGLNPNHPVNS